MVLLAVVYSEGEEVLEGADVVSKEHTVIGLANSCYIKVMEDRDTKTLLLGSVKLFIIVNCIKIS